VRILVHSRFAPNVGGIETVTWLLSHEWHRRGHDVTVVSDVRCNPGERPQVPFELTYRPRPTQWLRLMSRADLFVQMNVSLKAAWPACFVRRPWVAVHHGFYFPVGAVERDWRERLKLRLARAACLNIAVSRAVERAVAAPCEVIPNPYAESVFQQGNNGRPRSGLIFVGRLVSEKGLDDLLAALVRLREASLAPYLTIVGDGPERGALEKRARDLVLTAQVNFVGTKSAAGVADLLQRHEILVVPSRYEEAFGVVALEGAACGCVVLGSDGGGLPEAVGPAGLTFRRGSIPDLADRLRYLLEHPESREQLRTRAAAHLARHRPALVAQQYLELFKVAMTRSEPASQRG